MNATKPRSRARSVAARTRSTDGWSLQNILAALAILGGVGGVLFGAYNVLETRLSSHDAEIKLLKERSDDQKNFTQEVRSRLDGISQQLTSFKVLTDMSAAPSRGRR